MQISSLDLKKKKSPKNLPTADEEIGTQRSNIPKEVVVPGLESGLSYWRGWNVKGGT